MTHLKRETIFSRNINYLQTARAGDVDITQRVQQTYHEMHVEIGRTCFMLLTEIDPEQRKYLTVCW